MWLLPSAAARCARRRPRASDGRRADGAQTAAPNPKAKKTESRAATHKVAIQVNQNDKAVMDLALNNAKNIVDYYKAKGETVAIEIVTYGPACTCCAPTRAR